jgi:hypothetical protein
MTIPMPGHTRRSGLGDSGRYEAGELIVGELRGQVAGQHVTLGPLGFGLVGPSRGRECLRGLPALLRLPREHLEHVLIRQVVHGGAGNLLVGDRRERHPQRAQPHLVPRPHGVGEVGAEPFLEFIHLPIVPDRSEPRGTMYGCEHER